MPSSGERGRRGEEGRGEEKGKEMEGKERDRERGGGLDRITNGETDRQTDRGDRGRRKERKQQRRGRYVIRVRTDNGGRERHTREKHIAKGGEENEDWQESRMKYGRQRKVKGEYKKKETRDETGKMRRRK